MVAMMNGMDSGAHLRNYSGDELNEGAHWQK
jgi:hypothetical protein